MKGNVAVAVAGRMCCDGNEMICGMMKDVVGVGGDGAVEGFYLSHICRRKWRS